MLEAVPYQVHTILTDKSIQFAEQPRYRNTDHSRPMRFDMICEANGIYHRLTKPNRPLSREDQKSVQRTYAPSDGQVARMNRTIKNATVRRCHYHNHDQLLTHLADFMAAYSSAHWLERLGGLTSYDHLCKIWTSEPDRFILDPMNQMPGMNI